MMRMVEFRDQVSADAWILANGLRRSKLPSARPGLFYLTDAAGDIVGEWLAHSSLKRAINGTSVVETAWFDERRVNLPREMVN